MKRFRIAILSTVLLSMLLSVLLTGCGSKPAATAPEEGSAVRSKEVGSQYDEGSAVRSKEVGSQENTDISVDGDTGVE
ncbi:hypothetical protein [Butyricicoccus sp.]|uniref:hypothetical protein n=1 Tax=Butyricicoccus sp. TaxID=2049021 RepID=UPI003F1610DA